jgi:hypothetical protein
LVAQFHGSDNDENRTESFSQLGRDTHRHDIDTSVNSESASITLDEFTFFCLVDLLSLSDNVLAAPVA